MHFRKVSNSKVIIRSEVLGRVITLPKQMSSYSPAKDGSNDKPLASLVVDSWRAADSLYPSLQFGKYQAFVIFHAGVGRDLDLVSALGYDPAPFDIPSLTFNLSSLRKYLGDAAYAGVPVDGGSFRITNTMILPETETRLLSVTGGVDTLQGSINGLLANSFGSFLGLPDLLNTKTSRSAIGMLALRTRATSSGKGTPHSCAPRRTASRSTERAKDFSFSRLTTLSTGRSDSFFDGRTRTQAPTKPASSSAARMAFIIGVVRWIPVYRAWHPTA